MKTYTVTYNLTLTIEVQADSADEAERLADRELPSHCDVNCAVSCHRIATSPAQTRHSRPVAASAGRPTIIPSALSRYGDRE